MSSTPQESRTSPSGGVVAPLRPPVGRGVQAAERGRREHQPGRAAGTGPPASARRQVERDHARDPAHLPRRHRVRRVVGPPRPAHPVAPPGGRRAARRPPRRSRSAGPAAGRAWPASGAPARRRTRPGIAAGRVPPGRARVASSSGVPGGHVAEQQVGVAGQRLGAGGHHEVGAEVQRALAERGGGGVVDRDQRAGRVRARRPAPAMSHTSRPGLAGVSSSTSRTPVERRVRPGGRHERRPVRRSRRQGARRRTPGSGSSRRRAAPRVSPGRSTASSSRGDRGHARRRRPGSRRPPARRSPPPAAAGSGCPAGRSRRRPAPARSTGRGGTARRTPARAGTAGPAPAAGSPACTHRVPSPYGVDPAGRPTGRSVVTPACVSRLISAATATLRVDALVADQLDLLGDRHLHAVRAGQVADRQAALHALGGLPGGRLRLLQGLAPAQVLAEGAVARQRRRAGARPGRPARPGRRRSAGRRRAPRPAGRSRPARG